MPRIVLVGPPNAGKTALFNQLTGLRSRTVNFPGSTVEMGEGRSRYRDDWTIIDTPGIVSVVPKTEDEKVTIAYLNTHVPDVVVIVVDMTQLARHFGLVRWMMAAKFRFVIAVTMADLGRKRGITVDSVGLSEAVGCPIILVNSRSGEGVAAISVHIAHLLVTPGLGILPLPTVLSVEAVQAQYRWAKSITQPYVSTGFGSGIDIDNWTLHPLFGPAIFIMTMVIFFWSIFALAAPVMGAIDFAFGWGGQWLTGILPQSWWTGLLVNGVWNGLGSVFVFLPQIFILFVGLGILEDSGYLARGAVIIDRPLSAIGLTGRSFVPLLSGYACAIPAMMAARTISGKWERRMTIAIIPLMSCSARLPVYGLLLTILFNGNPLKSGLGLVGIYIGSMIVGGLVAALVSIFNRHRGKRPPGFQIELPMWRMPIPVVVVRTAVEKSIGFVRRAGPVIIIVAVVLWILSQFPTPQHPYSHAIGQWVAPALAPMGVDWRVAVALLAAFAAREVFVSALAITMAAGETGPRFLTALHSATLPSGYPIFTPSTIVGLILFFMIAMQCGATIATTQRETGSWKLAIGLTIGYIMLAYFVAICAVQGLRLIGIM